MLLLMVHLPTVKVDSTRKILSVVYALGFTAFALFIVMVFSIKYPVLLPRSRRLC